MKKVSIFFSHFRTFRWTAIAIWHLKHFGLPVPSEIIVVNNSPGHPSIKVLTETELGEGVRVIDGDPDFPSHGNGLDIAARVATGDYFFTSESDAFPFRCGWFDEYVKAVGDGHDLIGPEIPQSAGRYVHPAGTLMSRKVYEAALEWQGDHVGWLFCPGAGEMMGCSDRPYHVVCSTSEWVKRAPLDSRVFDLSKQMVIWSGAGPYQEMRSFDEDAFENYGQRTGIRNFEPVEGKRHYLKIGYEAGQWLSYFAEAKGFKVLRAPVNITWMDGHEGRQAASAMVFDGFLHCWCGTVSNVAGKDLPPDVTAFKLSQQDYHFSQLPDRLQKQILELERRHEHQ